MRRNLSCKFCAGSLGLQTFLLTSRSRRPPSDCTLSQGDAALCLDSGHELPSHHLTSGASLVAYASSRTSLFDSLRGSPFCAVADLRLLNSVPGRTRAAGKVRHVLSTLYKCATTFKESMLDQPHLILSVHVQCRALFFQWRAPIVFKHLPSKPCRQSACQLLRPAPGFHSPHNSSNSFPVAIFHICFHCILTAF